MKYKVGDRVVSYGKEWKVYDIINDEKETKYAVIGKKMIKVFYESELEPLVITNRQWLIRLTNEELANEIGNLYRLYLKSMPKYDDFNVYLVEWLKDKHKQE